ncbi:hypothetical protein MmiHf6_16950 [Methanimicrococcus hongohii]|uniref:Uncharacterized protein n=1 Tax=Methanimicrococcus hongohii TaxID=3028295 RepID=A0AA96ZTB9_9EURY|nr:hypothetical protein MmiHf6_16950 [Methanimicrococcus sp. Hf6]
MRNKIKTADGFEKQNEKRGMSFEKIKQKWSGSRAPAAPKITKLGFGLAPRLNSSERVHRIHICRALCRINAGNHADNNRYDESADNHAE